MMLKKNIKHLLFRQSLHKKTYLSRVWKSDRRNTDLKVLTMLKIVQLRKTGRLILLKQKTSFMRNKQLDQLARIRTMSWTEKFHHKPCWSKSWDSAPTTIKQLCVTGRKKEGNHCGPLKSRFLNFTNQHPWLVQRVSLSLRACEISWDS